MGSYQVNRVMYDFAKRADGAAAVEDKNAFLAQYSLTEDERAALVDPNFSALLSLGGLPNLVYRYYARHGFAAKDFAQRLADEEKR